MPAYLTMHGYYWETFGVKMISAQHLSKNGKKLSYQKHSWHGIILNTVKNWPHEKIYCAMSKFLVNNFCSYIISRNHLRDFKISDLSPSGLLPWGTGQVWGGAHSDRQLYVQPAHTTFPCSQNYLLYMYTQWLNAQQTGYKEHKFLSLHFREVLTLTY